MALDTPYNSFPTLKRRKIRMGDALVTAGFLDRPTLRAALARKRNVPVPLGQILIKNGLVTDTTITDTLALQWGLSQVDLLDHPPHKEALQAIDLRTCFAIGCMPWRIVDGVIILAIADPAMVRNAREACGLKEHKIALVLATRQNILDALSQAFRAELEHAARTRCPMEASCGAWSGARVTASAILIALCLFAGFLIAPRTTLWLVFGWIIMFNFGAAFMRCAALLARRNHRPPKPIRRALAHADLPVISLLIPLHREDKVLAALTSHIAAIDYPRELMDVKLLVEEKDRVTLDAIAALPFSGAYDVLRVPDHALKTKPRALNYALEFCTGDLVGILDAEDRPDSGQLRAVVKYLWHAPPNVACVQGRLDFYNAKRNWMSRCFTLEYAIWFNVLMRGMRALDLPIPLGGTSVYFRRDILEKLGAWDAYNVTEDADLGMRIARAGYKTEMLPSVTMEEANARFIPWIKQRSRWLKGYIVTWAVHMRKPRQLLRDLGWKSFLAFQILFLGGVTSYLSAPLLLGLWVGALGFDLSQYFGGVDMIWYITTASMIFGQTVMLMISAVACQPQDKRHLLPWIITAPIYWQIGAFATLKAVAEIFYAPFFWDKTTHGDQSDQESFKPTDPNGPIDKFTWPG